MLLKNQSASELGDGQQVSAFMNMNEIMKWWRVSFDRHCLDDNEMQINIITYSIAHTSKLGLNLIPLPLKGTTLYGHS